MFVLIIVSRFISPKEAFLMFNVPDNTNPD